jgi:stress response protein YsnF
MAKVTVPVKDGEIVISTVTSTKTFTVTDGTITASSEDVALIVASIDGASIEGAKK